MSLPSKTSQAQLENRFSSAARSNADTILASLPRLRRSAFAAVSNGSRGCDDLQNDDPAGSLIVVCTTAVRLGGG
jgi:hypothetical protein